ncbi:hypothetical protein [Jiulongibacter sp. NS-SX5]|uniref:hypothetical protein n=1 Tax=Jiulongibacter sp. NS-SX5 TaxID=3463854 RepID=UPI00405974FC
MRAVLTFIFCVVLFSCSSDQEETLKEDATPTHTIIFMDKTSSVDVSKPFVAQKYKQVIQEAIDQNIRKEGDILDVYFVHENTSKGKSLHLVSRTEKENVEGMNATDLEASQTSYTMMITKEKNIFTRQAFSKLTLQNGGKSNEETNLRAIVPILSDAAANGASVKAYVLSDMVQSQKSGRDFHKSAPKSEQVATQWAEEDLNSLSEYNLIGTEITMVLPFEPTTSSSVNNPNVTSYWITLLGNLGATVSEL